MHRFTFFLALGAMMFAGAALAGSGSVHHNTTTGDSTTSSTSISHGGNAVSGSTSGVFGSGNSEVNVDASSHNVVAPRQNTNVRSSNAQQQGQQQGQGITFSDDDSVVYKEAENSAASPSDLILGTCQAGVAAQTQMGGGSLGGPDEVCLLFTLSQMYESQGNHAAAADALKRADDTLKWRNNPIRRFFQAIPALGRMF